MKNGGAINQQEGQASEDAKDKANARERHDGAAKERAGLVVILLREGIGHSVLRPHAQAKGGNIFLNMGGKHPNEAFTVFVPASSKDEFKDPSIYNGKTISVTGKIEEHNGKPQMIVKSPSDITVKEGETKEAAASATPAAEAKP